MKKLLKLFQGICLAVAASLTMAAPPPAGQTAPAVQQDHTVVRVAESKPQRVVPPAKHVTAKKLYDEGCS